MDRKRTHLGLMRSDKSSSFVFALLPVWLLGLMILIGFGLEISIYDTLLWQGKLPLLLLILWPLWRRFRPN